MIRRRSLLIAGSVACASASGRLLLSQDFSQVTVDKVAAGFRFTEGPVWSKDGFLLFSDVPSSRILRFTPGGKPEIFRENSPGASGNALDSQGRLYTCETRARRLIRADKNGKSEVLAERWEGKLLNGPDDVVVSRSGHVYFTDPAFGYQSDQRELDFYGVYQLPPKGAMRLIAKPAGRPNGIALSENGRVLYVSNSDEHNVRAYDVDRNGDVSNERVFVSGIKGAPGGVRTDEKGNLYVAAQGLAIYNPQGRLERTFELSEIPSNCAFGDPDFQTLYITARSSIFRVRLDVRGAVY
jgi:gluconolactonase